MHASLVGWLFGTGGWTRPHARVVSLLWRMCTRTMATPLTCSSTCQRHQNLARLGLLVEMVGLLVPRPRPLHMHMHGSACVHFRVRAVSCMQCGMIECVCVWLSCTQARSCLCASLHARMLSFGVCGTVPLVHGPMHSWALQRVPPVRAELHRHRHCTSRHGCDCCRGGRAYMCLQNHAMLHSSRATSGHSPSQTLRYGPTCRTSLTHATTRTHQLEQFLLPTAADVPERRELSVNEAASARAFLLRLVGALTQLGAPSSLVEHLGQKAARGMMLRMDGEIKPPLIQPVSSSCSSYTGGPPSIHLT
jgi:hypothetical protein